MEIIVSHNNTDLDGLAAMIAAKKIYPDAELVNPEILHRNVREFMALHKDTFTFTQARDIPCREVTRLILVDTRSPGRIGEVRAVLQNPQLEIHVFDHHPRAADDIRGTYEVIEQVGAATTLLVELIRKQDLPVSSFEATVLALGIYEDTGSLTFATTTARDAGAVAYLLAKGAKLPVIADFIERPLTEKQRNLLNKLIVSAQADDINGVKILVAAAETEEYIDGLALLVHKLMEVDHTDVVIAAVHMDDRVYLTARSRVDSVDVSQVLAAFAGGGHAAAASAIVRGRSIGDLIPEIRELLKENIRPELTAEKIMSAPVKTVTLDKSIEEAGKILLRYGHTGLPVLDGETIAGIISRRDIEKAKNHGLGHAPVKGFMSRQVITISRQTTLPEIQDLMIDNDIGRLPVVEDGKIIGIVSRTDVLRTLHGEAYPEKYEKIYNIVQPASGMGADHIPELLDHNLPAGVRDILNQISSLADREGFSVFAVGGFVRDLILGVKNLDIDLVVEGNGPAFARRLAEFLGGRARLHEKFGTAVVILPGNFRIDVATARTEYYESPAALPVVEASSIKQDLFRRDFTVNAMAVTLSAKNFGSLVDYFGGRRDLAEGIIRVLYNLSFVEDPTRILRAVRFEQRYKFKMEKQTELLAKNAIKMLAKLSADRTREELKHILGEVSPLGAVLRMHRLNIWPFILPEAVIDRETVDILKKLPAAVEFGAGLGLQKMIIWIVYLAVLVKGSGCRVIDINRRLKLTKEEQKLLSELLYLCPEMADKLARAKPIKMSEIAALVTHLTDGAFIYILANTSSDVVRERLKNYLTRSKNNKLLISGEDIKKLGYPPGPHFREALDTARAARLDGDISTREEEINFVHDYLKKIGIRERS